MHNIARIISKAAILGLFRHKASMLRVGGGTSPSHYPPSAAAYAAVWSQ